MDQHGNLEVRVETAENQSVIDTVVAYYQPDPGGKRERTLFLMLEDGE